MIILYHTVPFNPTFHHFYPRPFNKKMTGYSRQWRKARSWYLIGGESSTIVTAKTSIGEGNQRGGWPLLTCPQRIPSKVVRPLREYRYNFTFVELLPLFVHTRLTDTTTIIGAADPRRPRIGSRTIALSMNYVRR